jgi:hypothetical protein
LPEARISSYVVRTDAMSAVARIIERLRALGAG